MRFLFFPIYLVVFLPFFSFSQEQPSFVDNKVLLMKETYVGVVVHTSSWGLSYRSGKHKTGTRKRFIEAEFVGMKNPKEVKFNPNYDNSKSYVYGKLNYLYILRLGYGLQKIITQKPYWGGVELRYIAMGGLSLGITKPVYLYILNVATFPYEGYYLTEEKYNPAKHDIDNIYGRAPFTKGLNECALHPGLYGKFGFNFEFGANKRMVKAIEVGAVVDAYAKRIPIMAFETGNQFFLSLYISINFGGRYNRHG